MNQRLLETRTRGSFLFPFELYHTTDPIGTYFVSCHWHTDVEILHMQQGQIQLFINGEPYLIEKDTIVFINREELHHLHSVVPDVIYDAAVFPLEFLAFDTMDYCQQKYLLPLIQKRLTFPRLIQSSHPCYQELLHQLHVIEQLHTQFPAGYQMATKAALFQILSILIQHNALIAETDSEFLPNERKQELLRRIIVYVKAHAHEKVSLEETAAHFYMSANYFCKYFKKQFGYTFTGYLNNLRLEHACRLLSETALPIMEISMQCGFDNLSYFNRLFRQKKSVTPSKYRQLCGRQD